MLGEQTRHTPFRWWFLPSWLGLDAPCVVSTWTWAVSQASETTWNDLVAAALFLVVWCIYLTDRLVDVARCQDWEKATGRLRFGRDWRVLFLVCLGCCMVSLLCVLWIGLPAEVIERGLLVAVGVGLHGLLFVIPIIFGVKLPGKEFGVGLFFALGAYASLGANLPMLPLFASIALVVAFNCLVIAARDSDSDEANDPGGVSRWWRSIHRDLLWIGAALAILAAACAILTGEPAFYLSVAASFAALTLLHYCARRLSGDAVRAVADFALFTPIPIMGLWRW